MEKGLEPSLRKAIDWLEARGYRYAIIGGVAVSQWGFMRTTDDVDLKLLVPNSNYPAIRAALRAAFPDRARKHVPENTFIVDVVIEGVIVDFLLALPGYEELIIERASQRDLGGWKAWVCSIEDLIIQKSYAGRGKDLIDLEELLIAHRGKLDEDYIENWVSQFAEALEKPEILTGYHRLLTQSKSLE
ncbi:MAG: nucleotidyltransferase [Chloroflexi bacterium]|nr:nucleotidyltransferase [Chloroflexota bacterium]